jgi:hypothetical protein
MYTVYWVFPNGKREPASQPYLTLEEAKTEAMEPILLHPVQPVATIVVDAAGVEVFSTADDTPSDSNR